jgi:hypothetical protein
MFRYIWLIAKVSRLIKSTDDSAVLSIQILSSIRELRDT